MGRKNVKIQILFGAVVLLSDEMTPKRIDEQLQNSFKSLMSIVNLITKTEGRKGLPCTLDVDGAKVTFSGGSLGSSMVRALVLNQIAEKKTLDYEAHKDVVKAQISALPITGRTVEAVRIFDKFMEGKALHTDVKKALLPPTSEKPVLSKAEIEAQKKAVATLNAVK